MKHKVWIEFLIAGKHENLEVTLLRSDYGTIAATDKELHHIFSNQPEFKQPNKRLPVSITDTASDECPVLVAVCDDGSIWKEYQTSNGIVVWKRMPDIPQDEE
jgi:hypothetical protein